MSKNKLVIPGPDDGGDDGDQSRTEKVEPHGWEYIFRFRALVAELEGTDGIVDVHWDVPDPIPKFTIQQLEYGLGATVPRFFKQFYLSIADGLELEWSIERDGEVVPGGGFKLLDFATIFDNWIGELWPLEEDEYDEEHLDFLWTLRGFDRPPDPDASRMVVVCVEEQYPTYDLFWHDLETRSSELLAVDFRAYMECMLETRGTYGWQHLLTEDGLPDDPEIQEEARHFYEVMDEFFPDADLERFQRMTDEKRMTDDG